MWFFLAAALSITFATSLITINKYVMKMFHFNFPTVLTTYHFSVSYFLFTFMAKLKVFNPATTLPTIQQWNIGFFGIASIVSMNYNLKTNSVGFYQLSKLCNIPVLVLYKYFFKNTVTPLPTLISLAFLLVGLTLFSVNDVEFSFIGTIWAIIGVITTCFFQTLAQNLQREYKINGTQMNHAASGPETILGSIASLCFEVFGPKGIIHHSFSFLEVLLALSTGIIAIFANILSFVLLGKGGPITYQVIGHVKTMLIFTVGLIVFPATEESSEQFRNKIFGLVIAMLGVIMYSYFEIKNKQREQEKLLQNKKEEEDLEIPLEDHNEFEDDKAPLFAHSTEKEESSN